MDCVTAQQLISDAMDRLPVDAETLAEAKRHCNECADCGAFVRAMLAVQRAPVPEPPQDLADRVVAQIRDQAKDTAYARARALASPAAASPEARIPVAQPLPQPVGFDGLISRFRDPRNRREAVTWLSSAAVIFILAGWGAVVGVKAILKPTAGVVEYEYTGTDGATSAQVPLTSGGAESSAGSDTARQTQTATFITASGGLVYRVVGPATGVDEKSLTAAGETGTDLGDKAVRGGSLFKSPEGGFYVEGEDGALLTLEPMQFTYGGQTFDLISDPIETIGNWPTLPDNIDEPRSADGSPAFEEANKKQPDGVFVLRGASAAEGIAMPPATTLVQSLAACPNWTFWTPHK